MAHTQITAIHTFLVTVEIDNASERQIDAVCLRLGDASHFMEGIGFADAEYLGKIDINDVKVDDGKQ